MANTFGMAIRRAPRLMHGTGARRRSYRLLQPADLPIWAI